MFVFSYVFAYLTNLEHRRAEGGATAVEYALVVGIVSVVVVGAVSAFKGKIDTFVTGVNFTK